MNEREIISVKDIRRDYGLSERRATAYIKASGKALQRSGARGSKLLIQRSDFDRFIESLKGR